MPARTSSGLEITELDPDLLAMPFGAQTNWHVITGAPSCGKTTLIDQLAGRGFETVPEGAREFMEGEIARGRTIEDIHGHPADLQQAIHALQLALERELPPADLLFSDGGLPSCLAWYRLFGLDPNEILPECFERRYASVFILDRLSLDLDGLRFQGDDHRVFIDQCQTRDYRALGYDVVRVPVLRPEERLEFVLDILSERGLL